MTEVFVTINIILAFVWGFLMGLNWNTKKQAQEAMDNFIRTQKLRDENTILKKQVEQLQKSLNENGII